MTYEAHPDAAIFPMMTDAELAELAADIQKNGLAQPIMLDADGTFLVEGRNRDRACEIAGVAPRYERLSPDTDIFTYIVSTNLHRRHLTPDQKAEIVRQVIARNPDKSNREIASIAKVSEITIRRHRPPATDVAPVQGADGKSYPRSGKYSDQEKAALKAQISEHPWMKGRDLAELIGVSHGTVQRFRRELQGRPSPGKPGKAGTPGFPSIAEQLERRRMSLPRFDDLNREELGMGSKEYGAEQHPDYPPGWTRDDAFRDKNGRIPLGTPVERANRETMRRCGRITGALAELVRALGEKPTPDAMAALKDTDRNDINFHWSKLGRELRQLLDEDDRGAVSDDDNVVRLSPETRRAR